MYECESWTIKQADKLQRIYAFELWCWRRLLRVPWTARRSNQSILKLCCCCSVAQSCPTLWDPMDCSMPGFPVLYYLPEFAQTHVHQVSDVIQPSHSLSSPFPPTFNLSQHHGTLATWCKELTHWKRSWCWERLKAGGEGDNREWDGWMTSLTWWTWVWASFGNWWQTGKPGMLQFMGSQKSDMTEWLNWMELKTNKQNWNLQKNIPYSESQWRNHNETIGGVQSQ